MTTREHRYFSDYVYKKQIDSDFNITKKYFSCYQLNDYMRHITSNRFIKNKEKAHKLKEYKCVFCNNYFDKDGWINHNKRNIDFHDKWNVYKSLYPELECNNFIINGKRASSFEQFKEMAMGKQNKRIQINIEDTDTDTTESYISSDSSSEEEEFPDYCNDCGYPIYENLTNTKKIQFKDRGKLFCDCVYSSDDSDIVEI